MIKEFGYEIRNILTKEHGAEAVKIIFFGTKHNKRVFELSFAIIETVAFLMLFPFSLIQQDLVIMFLCFAILCLSIYFYFSYFKGYSFPQSMYLKRINYLCTPQESLYLFKQSQFEYRTEQTSQIVLYKQIDQMIDSKNLLIFLVKNKEYVINKKCLPENYGELIAHLRNSSHCSYTKQDHR